MSMETLARDPKGLNRREGLLIGENDKVCRAANLGRRPLGSKNEIRTLASLRDSLLPKLMRGEVRVK